MRVHGTLASLLVAGTVSFSLPLAAQPAAEALGKVNFETSCSPEAQIQFNRAMLFQHSFWYRASQRSFENALKADPQCGIAFWGIALSLLWNPHIAPPPRNLAAGASALDKAANAVPKTERERDWLAAIGEMYKDFENVPHVQRVQNYARAMAALAAKYPSDDEAQIFYGLALNISASPADKTYANQLKGAAILEKIWERQPDHPGVAHYLIHLYDVPALAEKGLPAARRYAKVAPDSPHALHMPSHIFTRVGYWQESIDSNLASARVAKEDGEPTDQLHAMDYLVYAYLQLGQDTKAKAVIDEMAAVQKFSEAAMAGPFGLAASPARYAVEREEWKAAAALEVRETPQLHVKAITWFAKGLGAARTGEVAAAETAIAQLKALHGQLVEKKDAYWAEQVSIQMQVVSAWTLFAKGDREGAMKAMQQAAEAEDRTEKSPVTPGPLAPARELYGAMLLEQGKAREALAEFEATMRKEPNRLNTLVSAAAAASRIDDKAKARQYYEAAVRQVGSDGAGRPEVERARRFLSTPR
jgi:tetratricopeptide (TPR) repeat protein